MSPPLVDSRTSTTTSQTQLKHTSMQNPNSKGQIPSPFLFDFSGFPSEQQERSSQTDSQTMNSTSIGNGVYVNGSFASSGPTSGLSRPRLVKVRKNLASQPGRYSPIPGSRIDPGFNPFRQVSGSLDRAEDNNSRVTELHDQWRSWKPFSYNFAQDSRDSSSSSGSISNDFKFSNSGNVDFVFSANRSSSSLNLEKSDSCGSVEKSLPDEMRELNIGNKSESEYRDAKDAAFSFNVGGKGAETNSGKGISKGVFVFGSSNKKNSRFDGNTISELPDEMRKLNIVGSGNDDCVEKTKDSHLSSMAIDKNTFFFGSNYNVASDCGDGDGVEKTNDKNNFVFVSNNNVASGFGGSRNSDGVEKTKYANRNSISKFGDKNNFVFVSSNNVASVFGGYGNSYGVEKTKDFNLSSKASDKNKFVFVSSNNVASAFGGSSGDGDGVEKNKGFNLSSEASDKNDFVFGSNSSFGGSGNVDDVEKAKDANLSSNATDENDFVFGSSSNVDSGFGGSGNGNNVEKTKDADLSSKVNDRNDFFFGSSNNVGSAFVGTKVSELPNELKKLNIEDSVKADGADKAKYINLDSGTSDKMPFAFRSSKNATDSFAGCSETTLHDRMKKLNIEGSGDGICVEKAKEANVKTNDQKVFVFGSSNSTASSFVGKAENILPNELRKLNIGSKTGDSAGQADIGIPSSGIFVKEKQPENLGAETFHDPAVGESVPTSFAFQTGLEDKSSGMGKVPSVQATDGTNLNGGAAPSFSFSLNNHGFQPVGNAFEMPCMDRAEKKDEFGFTSKQHGSETPQNQDVLFSATGFAGVNQNLEFSSKRGVVKDSRLKTRRGKLRQPTAFQQRTEQDFVARESSSQEIPESPGCYSPMDFSPYQETLAADQCSRETSATSDAPFPPDNNYASSDAHPTDSTDAGDDDLVATTQRLDIDDGDQKCRESNEEDSGFFSKESISDECPMEGFVSGAETECFKSTTEQVNISSDARVTSAEPEPGFSSNIEKQESDSMQFPFTSSLEHVGETNFTFSASFSAQGHSTAAKHHCRKKNRKKIGHDNTKLQFASSSVHSVPPTNMPSVSQSKGENSSKADKEHEVKQGSTSTATATVLVQDACEKWRLRGNQAYAKGNMSTAEDYYSRGINCVSANETSSSCLRALALCYSNRAATRMSLGRIREALGDCTMAAAADPEFVRVQIRAANCHLALGEVEDALQYFSKCLQSGSAICLDRKIVIEASDGLQKAQKVAECMDRFAKLLQQRTSSDAYRALGIIAEALSISSYSERLLEMKAEALFMLRKYKEAIQLCEQTLDSAEKNFSSIHSDGLLAKLGDSELTQNSTVRLWRWRLISKSYFYLGRLEEALDLLEKQEQMRYIMENSGSKNVESSIPLAVTVRGLLHLKIAGNEAFQSGRYAEAVEHYTAALSCNVESRPFAAICFCNRAAANQALGQITDAIADCSIAIALDGSYLKAISRRATLHEMIRDYGQAANDLERLISLLEKLSEDKANQSGALGRSTGSLNDLRQARLRLSTIEEEVRKEMPLDMYLILGIEPSSTASDIKKAYRKAALRHHPDKAGQFLARSESGDDGPWKQIAEEVHKDADRLFKMVGEAYTVLSDPAKRSRYDLEEEMRSSQKSSSPRTSADACNYPFERSVNRRHWRSHGNSNPRSSELSRSNRYS